jgi:Fe-S oxidoreductase
VDELKDLRHTMLSCNHCGQCKWILGPKMRGWDFAEVCPIHQRFHFDAYSGQGLLNIAQELLEGTLSYEPGLVDLIYSCTTCGACELNCKSVRDMEVMDTILALRADCVAEGHGPLAEHRAQAVNVAEERNIYGLPHEERFAWLSPNEPTTGGRDATATSAGTTIYFVGCANAYRYPETARSAMRILAAGGVDFGLLGTDETCCGGPLWRTGQNDEFAASVRRNLEVFRRHGVTRVITGCAECYGTFRGGYPRVAPMDDIEVVHISEVIDQLLAQGRLALKQTQSHMTLTYHDPCLLARLGEKYVPWHGEIKPYGLHEPPKEWRRGANGVYDAPRRVLRSLPGVELTEMVRNQECGYCCGAGGGVAAANPELAAWIAGERLREARSTGAEGLVSCCPFCRDSLGHDDALAYHDLADLVASALDNGEGR